MRVNICLLISVCFLFVIFNRAVFGRQPFDFWFQRFQNLGAFWERWRFLRYHLKVTILFISDWNHVIIILLILVKLLRIFVVDIFYLVEQHLVGWSWAPHWSEFLGCGLGWCLHVKILILTNFLLLEHARFDVPMGKWLISLVRVSILILLVLILILIVSHPVLLQHAQLIAGTTFRKVHCLSGILFEI